MNTILYNISFFGAFEVYDIFINFIFHDYKESMEAVGITDITVARMRDEKTWADDGFRISLQCRTTGTAIDRWFEESKQKLSDELFRITQERVVQFDTMMDIIPCE